MIERNDTIQGRRVQTLTALAVLLSMVAFTTPIYPAAGNSRNPELVSVLLDSDADPHAVGGAGVTPIHRAVRQNRTPTLISGLIEVGAYPNGRIAESATPLRTAVLRMDGAALTAALSGEGGYRSVPASRRETPLHVLARESRSTIVAAIFDSSAEPGDRGENWRTTLDAAKRERRSTDTVAVLEDGAREFESEIPGVASRETKDVSGQIASAISRRLEQWFAGSEFQFALAAPIRIEDAGDDTFKIHFPRARLVERDGGDEYSFGNLALAVTPQSDTEYRFDTALPTVVQIFTGGGRDYGRIAIGDSAITGLWRTDLEMASSLEVVASDLHATDRRGRDTLGIRALSLSNTIDRGADRLWDGESRVTLSGVRVASGRGHEGLRLGEVEIATTVKDAGLDPVLDPTSTGLVSGEGREPDALREIVRAFLLSDFGRLEIEIALRDLISMDGGEESLGIGQLGWLFVLDDREELADLTMRIEAANPRLHEEIVGDVSADLIPASATAEFVLEQYPLRRIAEIFLQLLESNRPVLRGSSEPPIMLETTAAGTTFNIHDIHVVAPAFDFRAEGQFRIEAESPLGAVGRMNIHMRGMDNILRWAAAREMTETVDTVIYLQGLGRPILSKGGDDLSYAYEVIVPLDGDATINDIPLDSFRERLDVELGDYKTRLTAPRREAGRVAGQMPGRNRRGLHVGRSSVVNPARPFGRPTSWCSCTTPRF